MSPEPCSLYGQHKLREEARWLYRQARDQVRLDERRAKKARAQVRFGHWGLRVTARATQLLVEYTVDGVAHHATMTL